MFGPQGLELSAALTAELERRADKGCQECDDGGKLWHRHATMLYFNSQGDRKEGAPHIEKVHLNHVARERGWVVAMICSFFPGKGLRRVLHKSCPPVHFVLGSAKVIPNRLAHLLRDPLLIMTKSRDESSSFVSPSRFAWSKGERKKERKTDLRPKVGTHKLEVVRTRKESVDDPQPLGVRGTVHARLVLRASDKGHHSEDGECDTEDRGLYREIA